MFWTGVNFAAQCRTYYLDSYLVWIGFLRAALSAAGIERSRAAFIFLNFSIISGEISRLGILLREPSCFDFAFDICEPFLDSGCASVDRFLNRFLALFITLLTQLVDVDSASATNLNLWFKYFILPVKTSLFFQVPINT